MKTIIALSLSAHLVGGLAFCGSVSAQSAAFSQQFQEDGLFRAAAQKAQEEIDHLRGQLKDAEAILSGHKELVTEYEGLRDGVRTYHENCRQRYDTYEAKRRADSPYAEMYRAPVERCRTISPRLDQDLGIARKAVEEANAEIDRIAKEIPDAKSNLSKAEADLLVFQRNESLKTLLYREKGKINDLKSRSRDLMH
jgi:chromosome segregation ATPase